MHFSPLYKWTRRQRKIIKNKRTDYSVVDKPTSEQQFCKYVDGGYVCCMKKLDATGLMTGLHTSRQTKYCSLFFKNMHMCMVFHFSWHLTKVLCYFSCFAAIGGFWWHVYKFWMPIFGSIHLLSTKATYYA